MAKTDINVNGAHALLVNASTDGAWEQWTGGRGTFMVVGTFGGATVTLQTKGPDPAGTPIAVGEHTTFTENGVGNFDLASCEIRAAISGGSPSGLYATAWR